MADYNTFLVVDCKTRKTILATSSARKANGYLKTGVRVEVWNNNKKVETIYEKDKQRKPNPFVPYVEIEKEYIRQKQECATLRNLKRRGVVG